MNRSIAELSRIVDVTWMRPWLVWLAIPLALWWWLRRRSVDEQTIASTFLWHRLQPKSVRRRRHLWALLIAATLIALAAEPRLWPPLPSRADADIVFFVPIPGRRQLDVEIVIDGDSPDALAATVERDPCATLTIAGEDPIAITLERRSDDVWYGLQRITDSERERRIEVEIGGYTERRVLSPRPDTLAVCDVSGSPAMALAIDALATSGRVERVADPHDAAIIIARRGADDARNATIARVRLPGPTADEPATVMLPKLSPTTDPLIRGLRVEEWSFFDTRPSPRASVRTVIGSESGALLTLTSSCADFYFDPDRNDVVAQALWPILVGRLFESVAPAPPRSARPFDEWPAEWPRRVLLALLLILGVPWCIRRHRGSAWIPRLAVFCGGWLILAWAPAIEIGDARIVSVAADADADTLVASAPVGGRVTRPAAALELLEQTAIDSGLGARNSTWATDDGDAPRFDVDRTHVAPGDAVRLQVAPTQDAVEVTVTSPAGEVTRLLTDARGRAEHHPRTPGLWSYEWRASSDPALESPATGVAGAAVWVAPNVEIVVAGSRDALHAFFAPVTGEARIRLHEVGRDGLAASLPEPADRGVLWFASDPTRWPLDDYAALDAWVRRGGTVFTMAGPPFYEPSDATRALAALLPVTPPPPPRESEERYGVILLDLSGSLAGAGLASLSTGLRRLLENTPRSGRFSIAGFRDEAAWVVPPNQPVDAKLLERLQGFRARGGTRLDRALQFVMPALQLGDVGHSLMVLTDGRVGDLDSPIWREYGERLRRQRVQLVVVAYGRPEWHAALERLTQAASGQLVRVSGPDEAADALEHAIAPERDRWIEYRGSLAPANAAAMRSFRAQRLPLPKRGLQLESTEDAEPVLVDSAGQPALLERRIGRGSTLVWLGGADDASLPSGPAASRLLAAIGEHVSSISRTRTTRARHPSRRLGVGGRAWLCFDRSPGEPIVVDVTIERAGSPPIRRSARGYGAEYRVLAAAESVDSGLAKSGLAISGLGDGRHLVAPGFSRVRPQPARQRGRGHWPLDAVGHAIVIAALWRHRQTSTGSGTSA